MTPDVFSGRDAPTKAKKLLFGVGVNDAGYTVRKRGKGADRNKIVWSCPFYDRWFGMMSRCYAQSMKARNPAYAECSVCPEWRRFSDFRKWMQSQDWHGKQLDKDIIIAGNKIYSAETCCFVSRALNAFLVDSASSRSGFPPGAAWFKQTRRFVAKCKNPFTGKADHLGYFDNPEDAHEAWRQRKHELACRYADEQADERIAKALRERFAPPKLSREAAA